MNSKIILGIVVIFIIALLAILPGQFSRGGMFYSPFVDIKLEVHGRITQYVDMFGFKGTAEYTNKGQDVGEKCITITIYDLGTEVTKQDYCTVVNPGETVTEEISIPLPPKDTYAWTYS